MEPFISVEDSHIDVLHDISVRLNAADGFHDVLNRVVDFASALVKCDSCLIYVLEDEELVLRASKRWTAQPGKTHRRAADEFSARGRSKGLKPFERIRR